MQAVGMIHRFVPGQVELFSPVKAAGLDYGELNKNPCLVACIKCKCLEQSQKASPNQHKHKSQHSQIYYFRGLIVGLQESATEEKPTHPKGHHQCSGTWSGQNISYGQLNILDFAEANKVRLNKSQNHL